MGRSPAPVARGPGRLLSARDPPGANKAAESHPPPTAPPGGPSRRAPTSSGPVPPGAGSGLAPAGGCESAAWTPHPPGLGDGTRAGRVQARLPSRRAEGGGGSGDQTWAGGNHLLQPPLFPPPLPHPQAGESLPTEAQGRGGFSPPDTHPPPTLGWTWGAGALSPQSSCLCFIRLY